MTPRFQTFRSSFLSAAAIILFVTAAVKGISALGEARILEQRDPLFSFLTNRQMLALAASLELAVVAILASKRVDSPKKTAVVAWLATLFLVYRLFIWAMPSPQSCSCLGNTAEWLGVSTDSLDLLARILLTVLLAGSYFLLGISAGPSGSRESSPTSPRTISPARKSRHRDEPESLAPN